MRPDRLDVYCGDDLVGSLADAAPLVFEYAPGWLARPAPWPLAAIPLMVGPQASAAVQACFENLLPEGELRAYLADQRHASTLFSLLLEVAGDTAGGFVLLPGGQTPQPPSYEATSWAALAERLRSGPAAALDLMGDNARISLAGAQDKTGIALFDDGLPRLPLGTSPSTHILKPDIRRLDKVWASAANETLVMRAAAHCGLPTAEVFFEPATHACVVRRFDRIALADGRLGRLRQYDFCQLSGTVSDRKYEKEGGPGIVACADLIRRYSSQPAVDLRRLVEWIVFNLCVGNNDSHAKNLSLYIAADRRTTLTPFYDLMCTQLYPGLSKEFAFAVGGRLLPGEIGRPELEAMARELGMKPAFVVRLAAAMAQRVPAAMAQAVAQIAPQLSPTERVLAERLQAFASGTARKLAARLAA
ncbi:type II toxin-antitoxin system HipA family toxin [Derxia lacustris]|uniref:type II toxin-antitoxin system HipA family toxin n=1 Tax=Derxia lacustris TaxID=764842 RepID=UPI000A177F9C|nr:type II toxin-antitoxin system HipA family toxin [Derxia lacustris]